MSDELVPEAFFGYLLTTVAVAEGERISELSRAMGRAIAADFLGEFPRGRLSRSNFTERIREFLLGQIGLAVSVTLHVDEAGFSMTAEGHRLARAVRRLRQRGITDFDPFADALEVLFRDVFGIEVERRETEWGAKNDYELRFYFRGSAEGSPGRI